MLQVTLIGTTPAQLAEIIHMVHMNTVQGMSETALETRKYMTDIIAAGAGGKGKRDGSHGHLESLIQAEKVDEETFGVGNIERLNQETGGALYWMLLNNGGMVGAKARRVPGYFDSSVRRPTAGLRNAKEGFVYAPRGTLSFSFTGVDTGQGKYLMLVDKAIDPVNYIEKTKNWLKTVMGGKFSEWSNKKTNRPMKQK
jgi:hypothetical protein